MVAQRKSVGMMLVIQAGRSMLKVTHSRQRYGGRAAKQPTSPASACAQSVINCFPKAFKGRMRKQDSLTKVEGCRQGS